MAERVIDLLGDIPPGEAMRRSDLLEQLGVDKYRVSRALTPLQSEGRWSFPSPGVDRWTMWVSLRKRPQRLSAREAHMELFEEQLVAVGVDDGDRLGVTEFSWPVGDGQAAAVRQLRNLTRQA